MAEAVPTGCNFPSLAKKLSIGVVWANNKLDHICSAEQLWREAEASEMRRKLQNKQA
jgi:hypothetical protein